MDMIRGSHAFVWVINSSWSEGICSLLSLQRLSARSHCDSHAHITFVTNTHFHCKNFEQITCQDSRPLLLLSSPRLVHTPLRARNADLTRSSPNVNTTLRTLSPFPPSATPTGTELSLRRLIPELHSYTFDDGPYLWNTDLVSKFDSVGAKTTFCTFNISIRGK